MRKRRTPKLRTSPPLVLPRRARTDSPFGVVGIGASSDSLEALTQLLQHLPGDTGLGFVVVPHPARKRDAGLTEFLSRSMNLPVSQVKDGMTVQRNHVHVVPPNINVRIVGGILRFASRTIHRRNPVDYFFKSLAADSGTKAIGVILSGAGSDGTLGVKAIKEEGGMTFAQNEASAEHPGMPRAAVATGCVDFILPPEGIATELRKIRSRPYVARSRRRTNAIDRAMPAAASKTEAGEARLSAQAIIDAAPTPLLVLDSNLNVRTVNREFCRVFQATREEASGVFVYDLANGQWNIPELKELLDGILLGAAHFTSFEVEHDFALLGLRKMLFSGHAIQQGEGWDPLILVSIEDISERKKTEDLLRLHVEVTRVASEAEDLRSLTSQCLAAICRYGRWQVAQAWFLDESQLLLRCDQDSAYAIQDLSAFREVSFATPLAKGVDLPGTVWRTSKAVWLSDLTRQMGSPRAATALAAGFKSGFAFPIAGGDELIGVWEFLSTQPSDQDVNFLEAMEGLGKHLALVYQSRRTEQSLKTLTGRLITLQDDERRRIARELHDSTAQSLAALSMNMILISNEASALSPRAAKLLADSGALLDQIGGEVRDVARLLHPPMLDEVGLSSALQWLVQCSGLQVEVNVPADLDRLPREIETALFRIVQEGLSNVRRHAGTDNAKVQLIRSRGKIELIISDDGKGASTAARQGVATSVMSSGLGVESMRQRVRQLGGQFDIMPAEPGTTIKVVLPIPTEQK